MKHLHRPLEVKRVDERGVFEGYGSVFGVEDHYRDVVEPGAFVKSLAKWRARDKFPALLWQHDTDKPIGVYEDMAEDERGLYVRGRLLIEEVALAREAWALIRAGAVNGLSIGYRPVTEERGRDGINRILEIDLWEVSLVTFPANEAGAVTDVKQADAELFTWLRNHTETMKSIFLGGRHHGR